MVLSKIILILKFYIPGKFQNFNLIPGHTEGIYCINLRNHL